MSSSTRECFPYKQVQSHLENRLHSPSTRMQGVISSMNTDDQHKNSARDQQYQESVPAMDRKYVHTQGLSHNHTLSKRHRQENGMPNDCAKDEQKRESDRRFQRRGGIQSLDYVEPVPPTRVRPTDLTKARLQYIQVEIKLPSADSCS